MKKLILLIAAVSFLVVSCGPSEYNDKMLYLTKNMKSDEVQVTIDEEPGSSRNIIVNGLNFKVDFYEYIVAFATSQYSDNAGILTAVRELQEDESETFTDQFILTYDENGNLIYWGMLYDYLRNENKLISDIGYKIINSGNL